MSDHPLRPHDDEPTPPIAPDEGHLTIRQIKEQLGASYPGLFGHSPTGQLAVLACACGLIALVSLVLELWTDRQLARALGLPLISLPLGLGTAVLAALTARHRPLFALPGLAMAIAYGLIVSWVL